MWIWVGVVGSVAAFVFSAILAGIVNWHPENLETLSIAIRYVDQDYGYDVEVWEKSDPERMIARQIVRR